MDRNRFSTLVALATALGGGLAGATLYSQTALSRDTIPQPTAVDAARTQQVDARSALLNAIALGYTDIRRAGLAGNLYQVVTVDADGRMVHLYMDPQSGVVIKVVKQSTPHQ